MGRAENLPTAPVAAHLASIRRDLLGGRGTGASAEDVLAVTRNRVEVAGMTATRRLELGARQTGLARADPDAITTVTQLREAEVADRVDENTGRLRSRGQAGPRPHSPGKKSAAMGLMAVAVVWLLRRASRN